MRRTLPALGSAVSAVGSVAILAASAFALAGCASGEPTTSTHRATRVASSPASPAATTAADCSGVFVTVQFGLLGGDDVNTCAPATGAVTAAAALTSVGVTTAGTKKYGDQVVCRVNGEPSASKPITVPGKAPYTESCQGMPAAFAYWAFWVRDSASGKWSYATSGIASQQLKPGQSLGLKFTTGSDTTPPKG